MKALKIVLGIILLLIVILGIGVFYVYQNLDNLAEQAIERIGSDVTQTQVQVDGVQLELRQGRGEINGLSVANPQDFSNSELLDLGKIVLQIEPRSVRDEVIVLNEVLIDGANLRVEHQGVTRTNIKVLLDNVRESVGRQESAPADQEPGAQKRFMVEKLRFSNVALDVASPQIENRTLMLNDIERSNLGSREQGLTPKELALAIVQPLIDQAREKIEEEIQGRAEDRIKEAMEENLSEKDNTNVQRLRSLLNN